MHAGLFWCFYNPSNSDINDKKYSKLSQAQVYDILRASTTSTVLSANEQFFAGAQTVVSLLQTTQIISDVCFITMLLTVRQLI